MSLLFFDGFDGYDAPSDLANYGGWSSIINSAISSTVRTGSGKSYQVTQSGENRAVYTFNTAQSGKTLYVGFAFRTPTIASGLLFSLLDSSSGRQLCFCMNSTGKLELRQGDTSSVLATGTTILGLNTWYYIEIKMLVANSGGIFDCVLNGTSEVTYSGDTQYQSTNNVAKLSFSSTATVDWLLDDMYVLNSDGSLNNTYLGEVLINRLAQTGDSSVAFTRNTGATNYEAIDDMLGATDDTTTYVYATVAGTKDEYTLSNTVSANTIYGVKVNTRAQKDDVNPKSFKHGIKTGATQQDVTHSLGIGYANYVDIFETSDGGTTLWTPTTLDAAVSTIEVA
jgi:hypothetical protein